jgi:hypothetical protein
LWKSFWISYCQPSASEVFVYLVFSWMNVLFVCSSIQPYTPFAIAIFFAWGVALPPLWWCFPHDNLSYKLSPLQGWWVGKTAPGQLTYLYFAWGTAPPPLSGTPGAVTSLLQVFFKI